MKSEFFFVRFSSELLTRSQSAIQPLVLPQVSIQLQLGQLPGHLPHALLSLYGAELAERRSHRAALAALWYLFQAGTAHSAQKCISH